MEVDTEGALFLKPAEYSPILKEIYNFHTVAALLAGYGFDCVRLANDWGGADFLAYPQEDGHEILKIQLKGRPTINKKYQGPEKKIYMAFPIDEIWYLILHDKLVQLVEKHTNWTKQSLGVRGRIMVITTIPHLTKISSRRCLPLS